MNGNKITYIIIGIFNNITTRLVMAYFIMLLWNVVLIEIVELTYWRTVGILFVLVWIHGSTTFNFFKINKYEDWKEAA